MAELIHQKIFVIYLAIQEANLFAILNDIGYGKQTEICCVARYFFTVVYKSTVKNAD